MSKLWLSEVICELLKVTLDLSPDYLKNKGRVDKPYMDAPLCDIIKTVKMFSL